MNMPKEVIVDKSGFAMVLIEDYGVLTIQVDPTEKGPSERCLISLESYIGEDNVTFIRNTEGLIHGLLIEGCMKSMRESTDIIEILDAASRDLSIAPFQTCYVLTSLEYTGKDLALFQTNCSCIVE